MAHASSSATLVDLPASTRAGRYSLELDGRPLPIAGSVVVGRSPDCAITIDEALVSRHHAEFVVDDNGVSLTDLGSVNGMTVGGKRVEGSVRLTPGDVIAIGSRTFVLRYDGHVGSEMVRTQITLGASQFPGVEDDTARANVLELLGSVSDKALAMGDVDEAVRVLGPALGMLSEEVEHSQKLEGSLEDQMTEYSLKLADATGDGRWINGLVRCYAVVGRGMPNDTVDRLYDLVRKVRGVDKVAFAEYLGKLKARPSLPPAERFSLNRLEGLRRLLALRP